VKKQGQLHIEDIITVPDWTKRMDALNYDAEKRRLINLCMEKKKIWFDIHDSDVWKLQCDDET
jgi:hypothetical protein